MSKNYLNYLKNNFTDPENLHLMSKNKLENLLYCFCLIEKVRLDSPTIFGLDITSKCNLRCKHCFIDERNFKDELTTDEICKLLKTLNEMGVYQIYIMGGEPFCRDDIIYIIKYIKSLGMTISVNTNATLITENDCKDLSKILNYNTDWIQVSLDGANSQTHDFIRNSNVFDIVINRLKLMSDYKIPIRVNTVVTNTNINELSEIYKLCAQIGVRRINFNPLYPFKREMLFTMPKDEEYIKSFEDVLRTHEDLDKPIFIQQDPLCIPYSIDEFQGFFRDNFDQISIFNCRAGLYSFEVDPVGNVYPCTFMHQYKFLAGNIRNEDIKDIWSDDNRWTTILSKSYDGQVCDRCEFAIKCKGGCMAASNDLFNNINAPDPRCSLTSNMLNFNSILE